MRFYPDCFFFSSRRRHTRSLCDWSSDVCSSDLRRAVQGARASAARQPAPCRRGRSEERRVGKSVDLGGRRIIKKKKKKIKLGKTNSALGRREENITNRKNHQM